MSLETGPMIKRAETVCCDKTVYPLIFHASDKSMINILCATVRTATPKEVTVTEDSEKLNPPS